MTPVGVAVIGPMAQVRWFCDAGQVILRCRWRGFPLQVCVFGLNGDANRPLVHSNVAGQAIFADRGRYSVGPATQLHLTGDVTAQPTHKQKP